MNREKGQMQVPQILSVMIPLAFVLCSIAWAVSVYLMERERVRMRIELARLAARGQQEEMDAIELH